MTGQISIKELGWVEEALRVESLNQRTAAAAVQHISDPQLQQIFQRRQQQARQRLSELNSLLGGSAVQTPVQAGSGPAAGPANIPT